MGADGQAAVSLGRGAGAPRTGIKRTLEGGAALAGAEAEAGTGRGCGSRGSHANCRVRRGCVSGRVDRWHDGGRWRRRRTERNACSVAWIRSCEHLGAVTESIAISVKLVRVCLCPMFLYPRTESVPIRIGLARLTRHRRRAICHHLSRLHTLVKPPVVCGGHGWQHDQSDKANNHGQKGPGRGD